MPKWFCALAGEGGRKKRVWLLLGCGALLCLLVAFWPFGQGEVSSQATPFQTQDSFEEEYRLNLQTGQYERDTNTQAYTGVIVGARSDEEGSRSKERYFSPRDKHNDWDLDDQPPEFWNQFKTDFAPGTHVRIHPLLDLTELYVWEYIQRENIPTVSLYYNHGDGTRYRSLGCAPCTNPICSQSRNPEEIIQELRTGALSNIAERSGRAQDAEDGGGLETLRRGGYM